LKLLYGLYLHQRESLPGLQASVKSAGKKLFEGILIHNKLLEINDDFSKISKE